MSDIPVLSVVVPTHHRAERLRECLEALKPGVQTLDASRYEVIVSDDADDEATREMLREDFSWVRYTLCQGKGPGPNRNHGASTARGSWLVFIDDDCLADPDHLSVIHRIAQEDRWHVVEGAIVCPDPRDNPLYICPDNGDGGCFWTANLSVKKEVFDRLAGFDSDLPFNAEDMEFGTRVKSEGVTWIFRKEARVWHPAQKTSVLRYLRQFLTLKSLILYEYKRGVASPLELNDAIAVLNMLRAYFICIAYNSWHIASGRARRRWKSELVSCLVRLIGAPVLVPYLASWEIRYRRMFRARQSTSPGASGLVCPP